MAVRGDLEGAQDRLAAGAAVTTRGARAPTWLSDDVPPAPMRLDANDFAELYDRHAAELLGFFVRRTYDPEIGVDLVAETFAVAFKDRRQYRGEDLAAARPWLYGIARHRLAMFFRRGRVERRAVARLGVQRRELTEPEYDRIEELATSSELREQLAARARRARDRAAGGAPPARRRRPPLLRGRARARGQRADGQSTNEPRAARPARMRAAARADGGDRECLSSKTSRSSPSSASS